MEKNFALSALRQGLRESYRKAQEGPHYTTTRGLNDYDEDLPTFRGKMFSQYVMQRVNSRCEVSILDIGCGQGIALAELLCLFPVIKASGISGYDYRSYIENPNIKKYAGRIDYRLGDIQRVSSVFYNQKFDFIISDTAIIYSCDPLHVIKQSYRLLKNGGIAFFDYSGIYLHRTERDQLLSFWQQQGVEAELPRYAASQEGDYQYASLSVARGRVQNLPLPFRYSGTDFNGKIWYGFNLNRSGLVKKIA